LGGGALLDAGVYPIRAAQLLLGNNLRVTGAALRVDPSRGVDVAGQAMLVSDAGVFANVRFGFEHSYGSHYSLWGSDARLHLDRAFSPPSTSQPVLRIDEQNHAEEIVLQPDHQFERSVSSFAEAVRTGQTARKAGEVARCVDMVRTMELVDDIREQGRSAVTLTSA
jgi:predicted dehydrogenase